MADKDFYAEAQLILDIAFKNLRKAEKVEDRLDELEQISKVLDYAAAINSIRSLFDRMMWDMADENLRVSSRRKIKFPIFYREKDFNRWWHEIKDLYLGIEGLQEFLESVQLYGIFPESKNELENIPGHLMKFSPLAKFMFLLSCFDNSSKHRILIQDNKGRLNSRSDLEYVNDELIEVYNSYEYAFMVTDYNNNEIEFVINAPFWSEIGIYNPAVTLLEIFRDRNFNLDTEHQPVQFSMEIK